MKKFNSSIPKEYCDENIFLVYWKKEKTPAYRRSALVHLFAKLGRCHSLTNCFLNLSNPIGDSCPAYLETINRPISLNMIYNRVNVDFYRFGFRLFEVNFRLCFENEIFYNPVHHELYLAAKELLSRFDVIFTLFKNDQAKSAKKSFSSATAKPTSSAAAILEKRTKMEYLDSILTSKATLLVVPVNMLNYWEVSGNKQH